MKKGFTLIEVLFVLAIMAVIAGFTLPYFEGIRNESKLSKAETELALLKTAVESYYQYQGQFPPTLVSLTSTQPKVINKIFADPFKTDTSTNPATYGYQNHSTFYIIYSRGLDPISENWTVQSDTIVKNPGCQNVIESNLEIK
jgi:prepilin-type N-terminal cleavage/methylation domain-containing protein